MVSPAAAPLWAACRVVKSAATPPLLFTRQILAETCDTNNSVANDKKRLSLMVNFFMVDDFSVITF
jgi:hypothetical protein